MVFPILIDIVMFNESINLYDICQTVKLPTLDYLDETVSSPNEHDLLFVHSDVSLALRLDKVALSQQVIDSLRNQLVQVGVDDVPYPCDLDKCSSSELHSVCEPNFCKSSLLQHNNYVKSLLNRFDSERKKADNEKDIRMYEKAIDLVKKSAKSIIDNS